jgi:hypothetical protein
MTAVKHLETGDADVTEVVMAQAEDGSVSVETRCDGLSWLWLARRPCKVDYVVRLPRLCSLQVSGVSNSASVQDVEGDLSISSVSGPLSLKDLSGTLRVKTVSGRVTGENLSGPLKLETVSGHASLREARLPSVDASTVSANLFLHASLGEGPFRFHSVSGEVQLFVPSDSRFSILSHTISGRCHTSLPATASQVRTGRRRVDVQGGGTEIRHDSISGNFTLAADDAFIPEEPSAPEEEAAFQQPLSPDARYEVLERIERGELTAEDALRILSA